MTKMLVVDRVEGRLYSYPEIFAPKNEGSRPLFFDCGGGGRRAAQRSGAVGSPRARSNDRANR